MFDSRSPTTSCRASDSQAVFSVPLRMCSISTEPLRVPSRISGLRVRALLGLEHRLLVDADDALVGMHQVEDEEADRHAMRTCRSHWPPRERDLERIGLHPPPSGDAGRAASTAPARQLPIRRSPPRSKIQTSPTGITRSPSTTRPLPSRHAKSGRASRRA